MADYHCHPLWEASPGEIGNIDPGSLPISSELRRDLVAWAHTYDDTLKVNDPAASGFPTDFAEAEFKQRGRELAERLQAELGKSSKVVVHM